MKAILTCTSVAILALGVSAANATTINGSSFTNGLNAQSLGGINFTTNGVFQKKAQDGSDGVGVNGSGPTAGEIDKGETITGTIVAGPKLINSITFGLLFDGPEYGDVNEKAIVTIGNGKTGTLTATSINTATWNFDGINYSATNLSVANNGSGAIWRVDNPFAGTLTASLVFGAATGYCGSAGGACNNQSDYTLNQLVYDVAPGTTGNVPEPTSLGLLAAGMIGLGIARRRSRKS